MLCGLNRSITEIQVRCWVATMLLTGLISSTGLATSLIGQEGEKQVNPSERGKDLPKSIQDLAPIQTGGNDKTEEVLGKDGYWYLDAEKAFSVAQKEDKSVIMNFTGSDWCTWCIKLEGEVFSKREFSREALKNFVFLKLDFPSDKSKQSQEEIQQNEDLKSKFGVSGFPSIYICDAAGRPFAKTGYQAGGPKKYLSHVKGFQEKLQERNELLALATREAGDKKAELLDRALGLMDPDIVTNHFEEIIKEIVAIDKNNKLGLRVKYYAAQDAEERKRILAKIDVIVRTLDPQQALIEFEKAIRDVTLPANSRVDALQQKLFLLKKLDRIQAVDELLDAMGTVDGLTEDRRERILVQKAFNYIATRRTEEALNFLDQQIKTYPTSHVLVSTKGEILDTLEKHEEAIQVFDQALALSDGSETSAGILALKAYSLVALERTKEALELFQEFVDSDDHPDSVKADLLLQKAILLLEGDRPEAAELAGKQAVELADSEEQKREIQQILQEFKPEN
jgi:thioredoxin-related protein